MKETCIILEPKIRFEYEYKISYQISRYNSYFLSGFWDIAESWLRSWENNNDASAGDNLIQLWKVVTDWAATCVNTPPRFPNTENHNGRRDTPDLSCFPAGAIGYMACDKTMCDHFSRTYEQSPGFRRDADALFALAPIFDARILREKGIEPWGEEEDRQAFVARVLQAIPYAKDVPDDLGTDRQVCSPPCFGGHDEWNPLEKDWPHTLFLIERICRNLASHAPDDVAPECADSRLITPAYNILLEMWRQELPVTMRSGLPFRLPWRRILVRSGFMAYPIDDLRVSLADEREKNLAYLERILDKGGFGRLAGKICRFDEPEVEQGHWLDTVEQCKLGANGRFDDLEILDTHMAGIVRWLNLVGIRTDFSCDGHYNQRTGTRRKAYITCPTWEDARMAGSLIFLSGLLGERVVHQGDTTVLIPDSAQTPPPRRRPNGELIYTARTRPHVRQLLEVAEWLHDNRERLSCILPMLRQTLPPLPEC